MNFLVMVGNVTRNLLGEDFIRHFECNFDFSSHELVIQLGGHTETELCVADVCYSRDILRTSRA